MHFNSIKVRLRLLTAVHLQNICSFQFHKGSIKTCYFGEFPTLSTHFNSIKVRLRQSTSRAFSAEYSYFNSIKVRLRHADFFDHRWQFGYFNSIKVRLRPFVTNGLTPITQFQFHKGSIKTIGDGIQSMTQAHFNSIKVRLRRH